MPDVEIATTLGISEDTVSIRIFQFWAHACNYGEAPFTAFWDWYALRHHPYFLAVPRV